VVGIDCSKNWVVTDGDGETGAERLMFDGCGTATN
jgi:hypothetical protein